VGKVVEVEKDTKGLVRTVMVAAILSEVSTGAEGSGITTSALPAYRQQTSDMLSFDSVESTLFELMRTTRAPTARYMKAKGEDSQKWEDAMECPRVAEQVVKNKN
jgi:hypothetical protein